MSLRLFMNRDFENDLIYLLDGKYYDAITLAPYQFPEGNSPARLKKLLDWTPEQVQDIPSRPLFVLTHNKWIIFGINADGSLMIISQSGPIDNNERVVNATVFKVPDTSQNLGENPKELPRRDFPMSIYERFIFLVNNRMKLTDFDIAAPSVGIQPSEIPQPIKGLPGGSIGLSDRVTSGGHVNPYAPVSIRPSSETTLSSPGSPMYDEMTDQKRESSIAPQKGHYNGVMSPTLVPQKGILSPRENQNNNLIQQSYEILMKRLYGIPVAVPSYIMVDNILTEIIDMNYAGNLLNSGQIAKYILNPLLQPLAGLPSSPNRIITLIGNNGVNYLVKASYDPVNGQIYYPV